MANGRNQPTVDSYDRIRGEVPPPPEWTATSNFDWTTAISANAEDAPYGYTFTYIWSTPVFDLRPDLASQIGTTKQGVPIWRRYGRLRVQLTGSTGNNINTSNFTITARTYTAVFNANVQGSGGANPSSERPNLTLSALTNVTDSFFSPGAALSLLPAQIPSVLAGFAFPTTGLGGGEGYPVRYARVEFWFEKFVEYPLPLPASPSLPDPIALTAAVY